MDEVERIQRASEGLLYEMCCLGGADAMKNIEVIKEDAHTRGFDAGYEQGYKAAMVEFRVPDL